MTRPLAVLAVLAASLMPAARAQAQSLGTFSWQLQPFCNVVTVNITQQGAVYTVDGYDDQCGAAQRAPLVGLAMLNPDGTLGFGLNVVTAPGGRGVQIDARIPVPALSGPWTDSAGNSGTFASVPRQVEAHGRRRQPVAGEERRSRPRFRCSKTAGSWRGAPGASGTSRRPGTAHA